jgi:hypothetical protein
VLAYLTKCFVILLALWFARYMHLIPWNDLINLCLIVVIPLLIAAGAWQASKRTTLRNIFNGVQSRRGLQRSASEAQDRR